MMLNVMNVTYNCILNSVLRTGEQPPLTSISIQFYLARQPYMQTIVLVSPSFLLKRNFRFCSRKRCFCIFQLIAMPINMAKSRLFEGSSAVHLLSMAMPGSFHFKKPLSVEFILFDLFPHLFECLKKFILIKVSARRTVLSTWKSNENDSWKSCSLPVGYNFNTITSFVVDTDTEFWFAIERQKIEIALLFKATILNYCFRENGGEKECGIGGDSRSEAS